MAFKKGHIITPDDLPELLKMGRETIYALELEADELHEDEAGRRLGRAAAGDGVTCSEPRESRVNLFASRQGLLQIDVLALEAINELQGVVFSTLPDNTPVNTGDMLAGTKVIPLAVKESLIREAERIASRSGPVVSSFLTGCGKRVSSSPAMKSSTVASRPVRTTAVQEDRILRFPGPRSPVCTGRSGTDRQGDRVNDRCRGGHPADQRGNVCRPG